MISVPKWENRGVARVVPTDGIMAVLNDETIKDRFSRYVPKGDEDICWEWQGVCRKEEGQNYGIIMTSREQGQRKQVCTSRLALFFKTHLWPIDRIACHTCDNPKCCNPNHLYWGTDADNMADVKSRHRRLYKTSDERVIIKRAALIANQAELKELAAKHKMSFGMIVAVKYGTTWKNVTVDA